MVPFDHIAVMGIFGLNALDTLQLQISLLITMESNGGDFCTPVGCIRAGTRKVSLRRAASAVIAGLCIASRVYPTCGILIVPEVRQARVPVQSTSLQLAKQDVDARDISAFTRIFRRAMRGHDE